ncbi:hypothetical protein TWF281_010044 [Arthrobotrys megalospora]
MFKRSSSNLDGTPPIRKRRVIDDEDDEPDEEYLTYRSPRRGGVSDEDPSDEDLSDEDQSDEDLSDEDQSDGDFSDEEMPERAKARTRNQFISSYKQGNNIPNDDTVYETYLTSKGEITPRHPGERFKPRKKAPLSEVELYKILHKFDDYIGEFAFSSTYSIFPTPGITITGIGDLNVPVSLEQGKLLAEKVAGTGYRLDPEMVNFNNPRWGGWLRDIIVKVCDELGIGEYWTKTLQLSKMVVDIEGSGNVALNSCIERNEEATDKNKIATVAVVLPGNYQGGLVRFGHHGEEKVFDFMKEPGAESSAGSKYDLTVMAWYSDVKFASTEITSGQRITLIYELLVENGTKLTAEHRSVPFTQLQDALKRVSTGGRPVGFCLPCRYTHDERRLYHQKKLKFRDDEGRHAMILSNLTRAVRSVKDLALVFADVTIKHDREQIFREDPDYELGYESELDCLYYGLASEERDFRILSKILPKEDKMDYDGLCPKIAAERERQFVTLRDLTQIEKGSLSTHLRNMDQLAGPYKTWVSKSGLKSIAEATGPLYCLGQELRWIHPNRRDWDDDREDGEIYHYKYKFSGLILYPLSEAQSLQELATVPYLQWESFTESVNKLTIPGDSTGNEARQERVIALLKRCLSGPLSDREVTDAGRIVHSLLQDLSSAFIKDIEENRLLHIASPVDGRDNHYTHSYSHEKIARLPSLMKMRALFPKDVQFSFDTAIRGIVTNQSYRWAYLDNLEEFAKSMIAMFQESGSDAVLCVLKLALEVHPDIGLEDFVLRMQKGAPQGSQVEAFFLDVSAQQLLELLA